ncbi:MAG: PDC sensor domain-containing protein, partial [Candidatus Competibacteraceae bacterium]|nr:PDC sensor domain-containing protein [Candidatus Competibacteraceae bacterium]
LTVLAQNELSQEDLEHLLRIKIRTVQTFALNPILIEAVRLQNEQNLSLETIQQRDEKWSGSDRLTAFKLSLQRNKAGRFLKRNVDANDAIAEAFLTDNQGANVAAYPITSDYWQGDEEKWIEAYNNGDGKIYIGPIENDASTNMLSVQISAPVIDDTATIGVLVMGITLNYLQDKQQVSQN